MKEILHEWRRFLKENNENYITLDESQTIPEFLKRSLTEELLNEEVDPQALSIKELEEKPSEFYKKQLEDMKSVDKNTEKVKQRIKKDKELLISLTDAGFYLDDFEQAYNAKQLGSVTDFMNWGKGIINSIFGTDLEDSEAKLQRMKDEKNMIAKKIRNILVSSYNPFQREIFRAISLFTDQNFDEIRNPGGFDETRAKIMKLVNDGIRDIFKPTKDTFQKAKIILRKLAAGEIKPVETWRGYGVEEKSGRYPGLSTYKINSIIDVPNLSSFSIEKKVAEEFAIDNGPEAGRWGILFYVPKTHTGVDVDFLSQYEGTEKEIITLGKFKIKKMIYISQELNLNVPFNNLQDLKKKPEYSEDWKEKGIIEVTVEMLR
tara:strand:- start:55 stop:1179 length:1125 start_codon:yes stop_codon:yes gene_type:complete